MKNRNALENISFDTNTGETIAFKIIFVIVAINKKEYRVDSFLSS